MLLLADREHSVNEIVAVLRVDQPSVSKHLRVLRDVGLVRMRCNGRHKLYKTNAEGIRPLHEWASEFERYWSHQLNRVKERAEKLQPPAERPNQTKPQTQRRINDRKRYYQLLRI